MKSPNTNPKCPEHGKELDMIYPTKDARLCKFLCGCIFMKCEEMKTEPNTKLKCPDCGRKLKKLKGNYKMGVQI